MIFDRLAGLETEYAVRSRSVEPGAVIERLLDVIGTLTPTFSNNTLMWLTRTFCANGGAFYHEVQSAPNAAGLLEGATPECRGPVELLTYQRAQERLLLQALSGFGGVGLLKNSRDAFSNTYGVQENYEAIVATGWRLTAYRAGLVLLTPFLAVGWLVSWALIVLIIVSTIPIVIVAIAEEITLTKLGTERAFDALIAAAPAFDRLLCRIVFGPQLLALFLLMRLFAFSEIRRNATAHLISRAIFTGAGAVEPDGAFHVSERKSAIAGLAPIYLSNDGVYVYWLSNFAKRAISPAFFQFRYFRSLFAQRQRLQIALSDSNACEEAEYLKFGTAMLVIDMAEAGELQDAPLLDDPLDALDLFGGAPHLDAKVSTSRGQMSALEIQRWYCERARAFLDATPTVPIAAWDVVKRWSNVLSALESDPEQLVGRVDWVTKRYLLDTAGADASDEARKKIDLRYHELGEGYLAQMDAEGFVTRVTDEEAVKRALQEPPEGTPATLRSRYVRGGSLGGAMKIDWREVRIRHGWFDTEVIKLDDYR